MITALDTKASTSVAFEQSTMQHFSGSLSSCAMRLCEMEVLVMLNGLRIWSFRVCKLTSGACVWDTTCSMYSCPNIVRLFSSSTVLSPWVVFTKVSIYSFIRMKYHIESCSKHYSNALCLSDKFSWLRSSVSSLNFLMHTGQTYRTSVTVFISFYHLFRSSSACLRLLCSAVSYFTGAFWAAFRIYAYFLSLSCSIVINGFSFSICSR